MDTAATLPLKQLYPATAFQTHEVRRDQLDSTLNVNAVVKPVAASETTPDAAQASQQVRLPGQRSEDDGASEQGPETRFDADDRTNRLVYKVVDTSTGVVVQQLPTESHLRLKAYLEQASVPPVSGETQQSTAEVSV